MGPLASLFLSSALSLALLAGRVATTGSTAFTFLVWNLFLAWIPFVVALALRAADERRRLPASALLAGGAVWLLFLPNAPYLVTDLLHLRPRPAAPMWFDATLMFTFAWNGALLGAASLAAMRDVACARVGSRASWVLALGAAALSGVGIALGRFLRFNSWDVVVRPLEIAATGARMLTEPGPAAATALFAAVVVAAYVSFEAARVRR